jgi:hypothetical protein
MARASSGRRLCLEWGKSNFTSWILIHQVMGGRDCDCARQARQTDFRICFVCTGARPVHRRTRPVAARRAAAGAAAGRRASNTRVMATIAVAPLCGGVCMVVAPGEGEPDCPARIVERLAGGAHYRVSYYGWSELWDELVPQARIRPPSSRCARLMAEVDALSGLFLVPPTGYVQHAAAVAPGSRAGDGQQQQQQQRQQRAPDRTSLAWTRPPLPAAPSSPLLSPDVGRVVDRSVRQATEDGPMQVFFYLEHVRSTSKRPDGWYAAGSLQATSRLATGLHLELDVGQRWAANEGAGVRLRLERSELWVCTCDWIKFATHGALTYLPTPPELKTTFETINFGTSSAKAFPVSVLGSVLRCLPLQHARRHRESGDDEWFRGSIAAELSVINCASVLTPRTLSLPPRVETLRVPGGVPASITVPFRSASQLSRSEPWID